MEYMLNNLRKGMGVFFCYALLIGRIAMSFQNWIIASRPWACREPLGCELGAERPPGRTTRGRRANWP